MTMSKVTDNVHNWITSILISSPNPIEWLLIRIIFSRWF